MRELPQRLDELGRAPLLVVAGDCPGILAPIGDHSIRDLRGPAASAGQRLRPHRLSWPRISTIRRAAWPSHFSGMGG